jgi:hypothetical protein
VVKTEAAKIETSEQLNETSDLDLDVETTPSERLEQIDYKLLMLSCQLETEKGAMLKYKHLMQHAMHSCQQLVNKMNQVYQQCGGILLKDDQFIQE